MTLFDDYLDACQELADICVDNEADILLGVGMVTVVGAVIATGLCTTKFIRETDEVREEIKKKKKKAEKAIKEAEESGEDPDDLDIEVIDEKDEFEMMLKAYLKGIRWYAIPVVALGLGLGCIGKSHMELKDEVSTWAAAYVGLDTIFRKYRERVVDDQGKEKDIEYRYGARKQEIEEEYTDEKGKKKKRKKEELILDNADYSEFSKFFDETCNGYRDDPEYNFAYLKNVMKTMNRLLVSRYKPAERGKPKKVGKLYLNEIYDILGIERTEKGQLYGWEYDPTDVLHSSLTPIDFGILKMKRANRRFVNGLEPVILLDFNCERLIGKNLKAAVA